MLEPEQVETSTDLLMLAKYDRMLNVRGPFLRSQMSRRLSEKKSSGENRKLQSL